MNIKSPVEQERMILERIDSVLRDDIGKLHFVPVKDLAQNDDDKRKILRYFEKLEHLGVISVAPEKGEERNRPDYINQHDYVLRSVDIDKLNKLLSETKGFRHLFERMPTKNNIIFSIKGCCKIETGKGTIREQILTFLYDSEPGWYRVSDIIDGTSIKKSQDGKVRENIEEVNDLFKTRSGQEVPLIRKDSDAESGKNIYKLL